MMLPRILVFIVLTGLATGRAPQAAEPALPSDATRLSLDGEWAFRLDPEERGERDRWDLEAASFDDRIRVPGAWDAQGFGKPAEKLFTKHVGKAWYRRSIAVPSEWAGRRVWLELGGIHRYADVWAGGRHLARCEGYLSPFVIELAGAVRPGSSSAIAIRVDSKQDWARDTLTGCMDVIDAMDIQWGGLWRGVSLFTTGRARISDAWVVSRIPEGGSGPWTAEVRIELAEPAPEDLDVEAAVVDRPRRLEARGRIPKGQIEAVIAIPVPDARPWSPRDPHLLEASARVVAGGRVSDERTFRFGLRAIEVRGSDLYLNGRRMFLRGYGDDCIFPHTIAPPADAAFHRRRFERARDHGFNYVRHHSWWPPEEYFEAADETGFLLQPEFPIAYLPFYERAGDEARKLYVTEWRRAIRRSRSHPSVISYCMGNEIWGGVDIAPELYRIAKDLDPTRLVVSSDGAPLPVAAVVAARPPCDIFSCQFDDGGKFGWRDGKYDIREPVLRPVLAHEMGNFGSFPDIGKAARYAGGIRPFWLEAAERLAAEKGLLRELPAFVRASERLQALAGKVNVEAARRSSEMDGYSYWLLADYWTGSNGILDPFYGDKGSTAESFRKFNAPTVLLLDRDRVSFHAGAAASFPVHASRFEDPPSSSAHLRWWLRACTDEAARGEISRAALPQGEIPGIAVGEGLTRLGEIRLRFPELKPLERPRRLSLLVSLEDPAGPAENSWDFWVFPRESDSPPAGPVEEGPLPERFQGVEVAERLDPQALDRVAAGSRLVLCGARLGLPSTLLRYKPLWWLGDPASDANLGTLWRASPALGRFPHEGWGDLVASGLIDGARAYDVGSLPRWLETAVEAVDLPSTLRRRAVLFEIPVEKGWIVVCGLRTDLELRRTDPAAAFLQGEILRHAARGDFRPVGEKADGLALTLEQARNLLLPRPLLALGPGELRGLDRVLESTLGSLDHPTHEEGEVRKGFLVRQTDGRSSLLWETAPLPGGAAEATFSWVAGTGWVTEPEGTFTLWLGERRILDFGVSLEDRTWRGPDGRASLEYDVRAVRGLDSLGIMRLELPLEWLEAGKPVRLKVTGSSSGSRRWFLLFEDRG